MIREFPPRFMHLSWQILRAHPSMEWITSDHPLLRLGYAANGPQNHSFEAGWLQPKADIILPLSPRHLLHAQVGQRHPFPVDLSREKTFELLEILAQNARMSIFARSEVSRVRWFRPRQVDLEVWESERALWG
jgi:hypothetical protein